MSDNAVSAAILAYDSAQFEALLSDSSTTIGLAHSVDSNHRTPLQIAAEHGQTEMLRRLLQIHSVRVNIDAAEPIEQRTALMFAVTSGAQVNNNLSHSLSHTHIHIHFFSL
jgi:ankyrin repeat protein